MNIYEYKHPETDEPVIEFMPSEEGMTLQEATAISRLFHHCLDTEVPDEEFPLHVDVALDNLIDTKIFWLQNAQFERLCDLSTFEKELNIRIPCSK